MIRKEFVLMWSARIAPYTDGILGIVPAQTIFNPIILAYFKLDLYENMIGRPAIKQDLVQSIYEYKVAHAIVNNHIDL